MAPPPPASLAFSTAFGFLMVSAAAVHARGPAAVASGLAVTAVLIGLWLRPAATVAVLLIAAALAVSGPPPVFAALSGLAATFYLLLRHAAGTGAPTTTRPTALAAVGFTVAGLAATAVPLQLPWLPLLAPPAVTAIYLLAVRTHQPSNTQPAATEPNTAAP
jgi:hypothetical protein